MVSSHSVKFKKNEYIFAGAGAGGGGGGGHRRIKGVLYEVPFFGWIGFSLILQCRGHGLT